MAVGWWWLGVMGGGYGSWMVVVGGGFVAGWGLILCLDSGFVVEWWFCGCG